MSKTKDILVAEDSSNDFFMLEAAFSAAGFGHNLHRVRDGTEVIAYLKAESPFADRTLFPFPHLLILDVQMPKSCAFDVLRFLRERPNFQFPTIVFSGSVPPDMIQSALQLGAEECFDKPSGVQELVSIVQTIHHRWLAN